MSTLSTSSVQPLIPASTALTSAGLVGEQVFVEGAVFGLVALTVAFDDASSVEAVIEGSVDGGSAWFALGSVTATTSAPSPTVALGPLAWPPLVRANISSDGDASASLAISFAGSQDAQSTADEALALALATSENNALEKIAEVVLDGDSPTIEIENIPSSYRHLLVVGQLRTDYNSAAFDLAALYFNGDETDANYGWQSTQAANATTTAQQSINNPLVFGTSSAASGSSHDYAPFRMEIPNYSLNGGAKMGMIVNPIPSGRTSGTLFVRHSVFHWKATPQPINSLKLVPFSGDNFVALSSVSVYGIKSALPF